MTMTLMMTTMMMMIVMVNFISYLFLAPLLYVLIYRFFLHHIYFQSACSIVHTLWGRGGAGDGGVILFPFHGLLAKMAIFGDRESQQPQWVQHG